MTLFRPKQRLGELTRDLVRLYLSNMTRSLLPPPRPQMSRVELLAHATRLEAVFDLPSRYACQESTRGYGYDDRLPDLGTFPAADCLRSWNPVVNWSTRIAPRVRNGQVARTSIDVSDEFARFLRAEDAGAIVVRVSPGPRHHGGGNEGKALLRLVASLVHNLVALVPEHFDRQSGLHACRFRELRNGSVEAGLHILRAMPRLSLDRADKVQGLKVWERAVRPVLRRRRNDKPIERRLMLIIDSVGHRGLHYDELSVVLGQIASHNAATVLIAKGVEMETVV